MADTSLGGGGSTDPCGKGGKSVMTQEQRAAAKRWRGLSDVEKEEAREEAFQARQAKKEAAHAAKQEAKVAAAAAAHEVARVKQEARSSVLHRIPEETWADVTKLVVDKFIEGAMAIHRVPRGTRTPLSVRLEVAEDMKSVALLFSVNTATRSMVKRLYTHHTKTTTEQLGVATDCYAAVLKKAKSKWQREHPLREWPPADDVVTALCGGQTPPIKYRDPMDMMFIRLTASKVLRNTVFNDSPKNYTDSKDRYLRCRPFCATTHLNPSMEGEATVWPIRHVKAPLHAPINMLLFMQEMVDETCSVCHTHTKQDPLGGTCFGRMCQDCQRQQMIEISTLRTR